MSNPIMSVATPANYSSVEVESRPSDESTRSGSRSWRKAKIVGLAVVAVACVVMVVALSTSSSRAHDLGLAENYSVRSPRHFLLEPVFRYWNVRVGDHFYTRNIHEIGTAHPGRVGRHGYRSEGIGFWMVARSARGLVPLYRYWNPHNTDHFYTTNIHEIGTAHPGRVGRHGYISEGVLGYCLPSHAYNSVPLYRYWNPHNGDHFYTTNINEIGTAHPGHVGHHGYRSEGIACWVWKGRVGVLPPVAKKMERETDASPQEGGDADEAETPMENAGEMEGQEKVEADDKSDGTEKQEADANDEK